MRGPLPGRSHKRELVMTMLVAGWSQMDMARFLGVSHVRIRQQLAALEERGAVRWNGHGQWGAVL